MKFFAGLNAWMIPVAAIASFLFGGVWYGLLSKHWIAAARMDEAALKAKGPSPAPFVVTIIAQFFMAWMLAGLLLHMSKAGLPGNMRNGIITALFMWAGFVMPSMIVNQRFQMQSWKLTFIDGGHWLGVLLIQGALLGIWGLA